jgi:hypothetical protein
VRLLKSLVPNAYFARFASIVSTSGRLTNI